MKWSEEKPAERRSKHADALEAVKTNQPKNTGKFAEIARYKNRQSAADTARRLREKYGSQYDIRSKTDQSTREGVVLARYVGSTSTSS